MLKKYNVFLPRVRW